MWRMNRECALLFIVAVCLTCSYIADSAKILGIAATPAYSHFSLNFRLLKALADKGHEVTVISPFPQETPIKNYRDIPVVEVRQAFEKFKEKFSLVNERSTFMTLLARPDFGALMSEPIFQNENVQKLLKSGEKFDIVLLEAYVSDPLMAFASHFGAHLVLISPQPASVPVNYYTANPYISAYVPNPWSSFTNDMNFIERVLNYIYDIIIDIKIRFFFRPNYAAMVKKYLPDAPDFSEILYNTSIMLMNTHESVLAARPQLPNMIEIGGYHISPRKELPKDINQFLDSGKDGVIVFSLGSNLKCTDLSPETMQGVLKALSKIKQKVIWKCELEIKNLPTNVRNFKWLPQQDVMAHPNVVALMSHGGLLSTIETIYFGVPFIGIPVFGDQHMNVNVAVKNGYALGIPLAQLGEETVSAAIKEITTNEKYRQEARRRSKLMHDREVKPLDTAIYWIEYVLRHNGAEHFKSPGLKLAWYQRNLLDVYAFIGAITLIFIYVIRAGFRECCCRERKTVPDNSKKNK